MSDASKTIEAKGYLRRHFPACEVDDRQNPSHFFAPVQFFLYCDGELLSTIWFGRSVWDDRGPAAAMSEQQLSEHIKKNPGKIAKVMENGLRFEQR
ncbi:MAG: hypothetical protein JRE24_06215 [Deltaproteobacteria bacterium]|jgi:hypothetical protein|nr:hypothetical protein [Deltaproteobacteria bacterium]MBW2566466.1 hypothetical protein [Deltaproteobacteria bacterium]